MVRKKKKQGMTDGELYELLGVVNIIRRALRLVPLQEIKKGNKGEADNCPLANSFHGKCSVGGSILRFHDMEKLEAVKRALDVAKIDYFHEEGGDGLYIEGRAGKLMDTFVERFDDGDTSLAKMFDAEYEEEQAEEQHV